jgi:hypothetical protein
MNHNEPINQSVEKTVSRLSGVVEKQFGCSLAYETIESIQHDYDVLDTALFSDMRKGLPVSAGDWMFFPVFVAGDLAGAARIPSSRDINPRALRYLHSIIRMVLESRLSNSEYIDLLQELEENLRHQQATNDMSASAARNNVFQLRDYQENPFPLPTPSKTGLLNFSVLIESRSPDDIFKMAFEIHSRSGRFAFLPLSDLSPTALETPEAFAALGPLTVFVADVTTLTFDQQRALARYFKSKRDKESPQIIAGTTLTLADLKRSHMILPELWPYLSVGFLAMTEPFEMYKKQNLLDFFFNHPNA